MTHQQFSTFKVRNPSDNQVLLNVFQKNCQKTFRILSEFLATCGRVKGHISENIVSTEIHYNIKIDFPALLKFNTIGRLRTRFCVHKIIYPPKNKQLTCKSGIISF